MAWNVTWDAFEYANITGWYDALAYYNSITSDFFTLGLMFSTFSIMFIITHRYGSDRALAVSGFITFVLAGFFRAMGLLSDNVVIIFLLLAALGTVITYIKSR